MEGTEFAESGDGRDGGGGVGGGKQEDTEKERASERARYRREGDSVGDLDFEISVIGPVCKLIASTNAEQIGAMHTQTITKPVTILSKLSRGGREEGDSATTST